MKGLSLCLLFQAATLFSPAQPANEIWFEQPAEKWTEALPIGNGRLAAMVFGQTRKERIQLNEETIWAGCRVDDINPGARTHLKEIQQLLLNERNKDAYDLTKTYLLGTPPNIRSYQTLGDLFITWNDTLREVSNYRRSLNMGNALYTDVWTRNGVTYSKEVFISAPANMMVIRLKAINGKLDCAVELLREKDAATTARRGRLIMQGQITDVESSSNDGPGGQHLRFAAVADVQTKGGMVTEMNNRVVVSGADELTIRLTASSDYDFDRLDFDRKKDPVRACESILSARQLKTYDELLAEHRLEYTPLFNALAFELDGPAQPERPVDKRLAACRAGEKDAGLFTLYFQYGRYLLLSSSRYPARLPANLQGKWNPYFNAPWQSDYHTNINLQMNYWPADVANVSVTFGPLSRFMVAMLQPGRHCSEKMYGAKGWVMHHVTDIYGRTAINADPMWGTSPLAGAWMALNLYDHFAFTGDIEYLKKEAYPLMKASADFILSFLIPDHNGYLVTAPSMSPENGFYLGNDTVTRHVITYGPAIDVMIIHELFNAIKSVAAVTGLTPDERKQLDEVQARLPPVRINRYGGIQEWIRDYREQEPGHRHMSQLFGLYPGSILTRDSLYKKAARVTLENRLANGGGHTGWSRAWMINFYARLKDGEQAYFHLEQLLKKSTLPNLFDDHPPFQIDGNFGGTAGMAEMLLQSHNQVVELLPALPGEWAGGSIRGIKARGGLTIDMEWKNGRMVKAYVQSTSTRKASFRYAGVDRVLDLKPGEKKELVF